MKVSVKDLIDIYDNEISKNIKNKRNVFLFEKNKIENIISIKEILESNCYDGGYYSIFSINDPKYRIVMSLNISNKIINHYFTRFILEPKINRYLDIRNVATRINMGCDYGIRLIKKYLELNKKYDNIYVLKIDVKKYFYSIDHDVLKDMLVKILNTEEYELVCKIIDSTNRSYVNENIIKIKNRLLKKDIKRSKEIENIPLYEKGKGLPLGNMSSQLLSVFYLSRLDYEIIHNLKFKYCVRYMDDYCIISNDKEKLKELLLYIENRLNNVYRLNINKKKTFIVNARDGFSFLGYSFRVVNKKTIIDINKSNIRKIRKRIKRISYLYNNNFINYKSLFSSVNCYYYSYKYSSNISIREIIYRGLFKI